MIRLTSAAACLAALALAAGAASAGGKALPGGPKKDMMAEKAKAKMIEHLGDKAKNGTVLHIDSLALRKDFPDYHFFALRFRQYPVAMMIPKGMKASNVFAVSKEGKVEHLKDPTVLQDFFAKNGPAAKSEEVAGNLIQGWLSLVQEFVQDGFYAFKIGKPEVKSEDGKVVSVEDTAVATKGGNGELTAMMTFHNNGKLKMVSGTTKLKPGPRPICQATKLLDPDPVVRRMAEQDLLYMGLAARDYLMEQRAAAGPALRQAIDRLWQRIQKEGW
jgi:hypothetical protein